MATDNRYDALNRLVSVGAGAIQYTYNGDGVLVATTRGTTTTSYTVDLAAPLSQVLSDGSTTYLYGLERLAAVGPTGTEWYLTDAIGSVRLTLDETGQPLVGHDLAYTPFGIPQSGAQPALFGFAGEQWDVGQWHMAYLVDGTECRWFTDLWTR
ncbi:hypothetical protein HC928_03915 [bacterium]|nr:hypothetical protein [bacterium]